MFHAPSTAMTCSRYAFAVLVLTAAACGGAVSGAADGIGGGANAGGVGSGVGGGAGAATDAAACGVIRAADYDQTCTADSDCVAVVDGNTCGCVCPNASINRNALGQYHPVYGSHPTCFCPSFGQPTCVAGLCTLCGGALNQCADSGAGGSAGSSGAGGSAGAGGAAGSGGVDASTDPESCKLPAEIGPCDAAMPRYWFNAKTGLCEWFIYGGCGGNANRFDTMQECYAACGAAAQPDFTKCSAATDCAQASVSCCGVCDTDSPALIVAINGSLLSAYRTSLGCDNVMCEACMPPDPTTHTAPYLRVDCQAGRCVWIDTRQTEMTACSTASDCVLRNGLGCCERCGASLDTLVAVNRTVPQCVSAAACPPCVATHPTEYAATCRGGRCAVVNAQIAGSACSTTAGCGAGFTCLTTIPGGYCIANSSTGTTMCATTTATCPAGTTCGPVPWSQMPNVCMRTCTATSECRAGQQCNYVEAFPGSASSPRSAERVCWPACTVGMNQTCNDNPIISSIHGTCQVDGSCACGTWGKNPETGRCL